MLQLILAALALSVNSVQSMLSATPTNSFYVLTIILAKDKPELSDRTTCVALGENDLLTALRPRQEFKYVDVIGLYFYGELGIIPLDVEKDCHTYVYHSLMYIQLVNSTLKDLMSWGTTDISTEKSFPEFLNLSVEDSAEPTYKYFAYGDDFRRYEGLVTRVSEDNCQDIPSPSKPDMHACFRADNFQPQAKDIGGAITDLHHKLVAVITRVIEEFVYFRAHLLWKVRNRIHQAMASKVPTTPMT